MENYSIENYDTPFPFLIADNILETQVEVFLLSLFNEIDWVMEDKGFYRIKLPSDNHVANETKNHLLRSNRFMKFVESVYAFPKSNQGVHGFTLGIHQYDKKCAIAPHTDCQAKEFRLVINLNSEWEPSMGGVWLLSNTPDMKRKTKIIVPTSNTAFGFLTSNHSFHALSKRYSSKNYALVVKYPLN